MLTPEQAKHYTNLALAHFHDEMIDSFGSLYPITLDEVKKIAVDREKIFNLVVGEAIYIYMQADDAMTDRRLKEAMERLAGHMEDVLKTFPQNPENFVPKSQSFLTYMNEEMTSFDFSFYGSAAIQIYKDATEKVSVSLNDTNQFLGSVGNRVGKITENILDTAEGVTGSVSFVAKNLPYIIFGILAIMFLFIFKNSKQLISIAKPL